MFSLKLLGGAVIEGPQGPLGGRVSQRRRLALLSVLALSRERPVSRDKLLAHFWPESDSERARHSLADSLYQIRKELGESAILSVGEDLWLDPDVLVSDAAEFEDALACGDHMRAVALYKGPFLDGFFLSDAPEFERWAGAERERLARAYAGALEQVAEAATAQGDAKGAVERWRRLAVEDPYNARITLRLMEALETAGDRAGAIQQARVHATLLDQEFGAKPDPDVTALAEQLRSGSVPDPPPEREAHVWDGEAPVSAPASAGEERSPPPEHTSISEHAAPARAKHKLISWRAAGLLGVFGGALVAVLAVGWLLPEPSPRAGAVSDTSAASTKTIAVLPFANLSRDPQEEYFSDGLTEELITALSRVQALRVVARTSAFAFKGKDQDIREIGRALGVGTVLEGSVRKEGDWVRVTAQLINASDGFHLWSETYEREGTDLFAIQSELALRIAGALEAELTPAERARLARRPTENPEAHALYLKGRYFWNQRTRSGFVRAIEYFERAIQADRQYAAAYAGLAMAYSFQGIFGYQDVGEARERMRVAALRAIELDAGLAEAHSALAAYLNIYAWDSEASEREHLRAIALDPSYPLARHLYGNLLRAMGRSDEAIAQKRIAVELDPLNPAMSEMLGNTLVLVGRPEEALEPLRNAIELDSTYWRGHASLGTFFEVTGRLDEAVRAHQRAVVLSSATPNARAGLARVLARAGREDEARRMLVELQTEAAQTGVNSPAVATVFLALHDLEAALEWLEGSYRQRHPGLRLLGGPSFARLERDPRYLDLLRRIGLPP